jgi:hypothetical protein
MGRALMIPDFGGKYRVFLSLNEGCSLRHWDELPKSVTEMGLQAEEILQAIMMSRRKWAFKR